LLVHLLSFSIIERPSFQVVFSPALYPRSFSPPSALIEIFSTLPTPSFFSITFAFFHRFSFSRLIDPGFVVWVFSAPFPPFFFTSSSVLLFFFSSQTALSHRPSAPAFTFEPDPAPGAAYPHFLFSSSFFGPV